MQTRHCVREEIEQGCVNAGLWQIRGMTQTKYETRTHTLEHAVAAPAIKWGRKVVARQSISYCKHHAAAARPDSDSEKCHSGTGTFSASSFVIGLKDETLQESRILSTGRRGRRNGRETAPKRDFSQTTGSPHIQESTCVHFRRYGYATRSDVQESSR